MTSLQQGNLLNKTFASSLITLIKSKIAVRFKSTIRIRAIVDEIKPVRQYVNTMLLKALLLC